MRLKFQRHQYGFVASGVALAIFVLAPPLYLKSWLLARYELGTFGFALALIWLAVAAFLAALDSFSPFDD
jgi:hypothetical protein